MANFEVSRRVDENVLRLEVTVDNVQRLEVLECQDHLARVQLRLRLTVTPVPVRRSYIWSLYLSVTPKFYTKQPV